MNDTIQTKADELALAIAKAEGFYVDGSLPQRINNPGDMKLGDRGWGTANGKTIYLKADFSADINDKTDGASALRRQCTEMFSGVSKEYSLSDLFAVVAGRWTGGDDSTNWLKCVCEELKVTPVTTLGEFATQAPMED